MIIKQASGNEAAMPVPDFMEEVEQGWKENRDVIAPGPAREGGKEVVMMRMKRGV